MGEKLLFRGHEISARQIGARHEILLLVRVRGLVRDTVMIEFRTSSAFKGRVRVLGYGFGVRGRIKVKSRDYLVKPA